MTHAVTTVSVAAGGVADVPVGSDWLTPAEVAVERGLAVAKRAADWRLGRWLAKRAVAHCLDRDLPPETVEILAAPDGSPRVGIRDCGAGEPATISISHSERTGLAVAARGQGALGCDVERIAPRSERFVADYFTAAERAVVDRLTGMQLAAAANLVWSAKEAALKFLREGTRLDTRSVEVGIRAASVAAAPGRHRPAKLEVGVPGGIDLVCYWWVESGFVWTIAGRPPFTLADATPGNQRGA